MASKSAAATMKKTVDGPVWWQSELRDQDINSSGLRFKVFVIMEASTVCSPVMARLTAAIRSGSIHKFTLVSSGDLCDYVRENSKTVEQEKHQAESALRGRKVSRAPNTSAAVKPENLLISSAAQQLNSHNRVEPKLTALILKQMIVKLAAEFKVKAEDGTSTGCSVKPISDVHIKRDSKKVANSYGSSKTEIDRAFVESGQVREGKHENKLEHQFDFCIFLCGFYEPDFFEELIAGRVPVDCAFRLALEPLSHLENSPPSETGIASSENTDVSLRFWQELGQLTARSTRLRDVVTLTVDMGGLQYAANDSRANQEVLGTLLPHLYKVVKQRSVFDAYMTRLNVLHVPEVDVVNASLTRGLIDFGLSFTGVVIPLIVDALIEQVCALLEPVGSTEQYQAPRTEQLVHNDGIVLQKPPVKENHPAPEGKCPVSVYDGDVVNTELWHVKNRDILRNVEHMVSKTCELNSFQKQPRPSELWCGKYRALVQGLCSKGIPSSAESGVELALESLLFDSICFALDAGRRSNLSVCTPYPHPFVPQSSVLFDSHPGHSGCDEVQSESAAAFDSEERPSADTDTHRASFCVAECLDRVTMSQRLESARATGADLSAAFHFMGNDTFLLAYGHPQPLDGRLEDSWTWTGHTAIGFRDFFEKARHWPKIKFCVAQEENLYSMNATRTLVNPESPRLDAKEFTAAGRDSVPFPDGCFSLPRSPKPSRNNTNNLLPEIISNQGTIQPSGYDLEKRLLHVRGSRNRRYFSDGSQVSVEKTTYFRCPSVFSLVVCHGTTRLALHPIAVDQSNDLVVQLEGGYVLHPDRSVSHPDRSPYLTRCGGRKSADKISQVVLPVDKSKKKQQQQQRTEPSRSMKQSSARRLSVMREPSAAVADEVTSGCSVVRVSCVSGLVVELMSDPCWSAVEAEPGVRVRQYYLDLHCQRRNSRLYFSDGTLVYFEDPEDGAVDTAVVVIKSDDLSTRHCVWSDSEQLLKPLRAVTSSGLQLDTRLDPPVDLPHRLATMSTVDPMTGNVYTEREDGLRTLIHRDGRSSITEHSDGTRMSVSYPELPPLSAFQHSAQDKSEMSQGDSCQLPQDDAVPINTRPEVCLEHPKYARVVVHQATGQCEVELPGGLLLQSLPSGNCRVRHPNGDVLQLDGQLACFTAGSADGGGPVVHTLRLAGHSTNAADVALRAEQAAAAAAAKRAKQKRTKDAGSKTGGRPESSRSIYLSKSRRSVSPSRSPKLEDAVKHEDGACEYAAHHPDDILCESVDPVGGVWRALVDGRLVKIGCGGSEVSSRSPERNSSDFVMPARQMFVLRRDGCGKQLMTAECLNTYRAAVEHCLGGLVTQHVHPVDEHITIVRGYRPAQSESPSDRWLMSYRQTELKPAHIRREDLRLIEEDSTAEAGSRISGSFTGSQGKVVRERRPTQKQVMFRELLVAPELCGGRRRDLLTALCEAERCSMVDASAVQLLGRPTVEPKYWLEHSYIPGMLATRVQCVWNSADSEVTISRQDELLQSVVYRQQLQERRFAPCYFTDDGGDFMAVLRHDTTKPMLVTCPRSVFTTQSDTTRRCCAPAASISPRSVDLGVVLPCSVTRTELVLVNEPLGADLMYSVTLPVEASGLSVSPSEGCLPSSGRVTLTLVLEAGRLRRLGRSSVFWRLEVRVEGGCLLHVPVTACVVGGGFAQILAQSN